MNCPRNKSISGGAANTIDIAVRTAIHYLRGEAGRFFVRIGNKK
jgi:hypothetical protein